MDQRTKTGKWGARGTASARAGRDEEATRGRDKLEAQQLSPFESLRGRLESEGELQWIGARVGVVIAMGGVIEDGGDGFGVFDHGDKAHGPVATGATSGLSKVRRRSSDQAIRT